MVGQLAARDRLISAADKLVHAYLFLGHPGSGTFTGALAFAALILSDPAALPAGADSEARNRAIRLARAGTHPDVVIIEPEGSALRVSEAEEIARASLRTPVESKRKVIVVPNVDIIEPSAIGKLLKVIEEPPPSTIFVLLGQEIAPEFVTIASRCVTIDFGPLAPDEISNALAADNPQADIERLELASVAAGGDLDRARLLLSDDALHERSQLWSSVPGRLDGRGSTASQIVNEIRAAIDQSLEPLRTRQEAELDELAEWVEQFGERGSGRSTIVARHKREVRRQRSDELRFGLAILSRHYRDAMVAGEASAHGSLESLQKVSENLVRNPNEALLLLRLFADLEDA